MKALEDPKQKVMLRGPLEGSHGLVGKAQEPKPSKDTSPDKPRLGSCKAYLESSLFFFSERLKKAQRATERACVSLAMF